MTQLRVDVTLLRPDGAGARPAQWAVLDGDVVAASGTVPDDPDGRHAGHEGKLVAQRIAAAMGEDLALHEIPLSVANERGGGAQPHA